MLKKTYFFAALLFFVLLLIIACNKDTDLDSPDTGGTGNTIIHEVPLKEFEIIAKRWEFVPGTIVVNKGDRVRLKVTSADVTHGIALPDFGVESVRLPPNETKTVEFVADKTGTFNTMICTVYCGSGHGDMKGSIVVNP